MSRSEFKFFIDTFILGHPVVLIWVSKPLRKVKILVRRIKSVKYTEHSVQISQTHLSQISWNSLSYKICVQN